MNEMSVITDFRLDQSGTLLMCTMEDVYGDVYLLTWDFRPLFLQEKNPWKIQAKSLDIFWPQNNLEVIHETFIFLVFLVLDGMHEHLTKWGVT
jgi:hypothetical protein